MKLKIPRELVKNEYRHGDLRHAIIEVAKIFIRNQKHFEFSIQDLAALAGVSRVAVYRYFKAPEDVLQAIAIEGFQRLVTGFRSDPTRNLRSLGRAYIEFGLNFPAEYRVMFMSSVRENMTEELASISSLAFDSLSRSLGSSGSPSGNDSDAARAGAVAVWSLVHGFVMLALDGLVPIPKAPKQRELFIDRVLDFRS